MAWENFYDWKSKCGEVKEIKEGALEKGIKKWTPTQREPPELPRSDRSIIIFRHHLRTHDSRAHNVGFDGEERLGLRMRGSSRGLR